MHARKSVKWTQSEDLKLRNLVAHHNGRNWKLIAKEFEDKTDLQCLRRWEKVLNPSLNKGPWSHEEDQLLTSLVNKLGSGKWAEIAKHLSGRTGSRCRDRWNNHLDPSINKDSWAVEEDALVIHAYRTFGPKWTKIAEFLPGRTDNSIKNHWNSTIKRR